MIEKYGKFINIILILAILAGPAWIIGTDVLKKPTETTSEELYHNDLKVLNREELEEYTKRMEDRNYDLTTSQQKDWIALFPSLAGLLLFLLKYVMYDRKKKEENLEQHPVFVELEQSIREISTMSFKTEGRTLLFRTMLGIQLNSYTKKLREFLKKNKTFTSLPDFNQKCKNLILDTLEDYEIQWKLRGVPDLVITKFNLLHKDRINLLLKDIDTITLYRSGNDYNTGLFMVCTAITLVLKLGLQNDGIKSLVDLNGELNGLQFEGKEL